MKRICLNLLVNPPSEVKKGCSGQLVIELFAYKAPSDVILVTAKKRTIGFCFQIGAADIFVADLFRIHKMPQDVLNLIHL